MSSIEIVSIVIGIVVGAISILSVFLKPVIKLNLTINELILSLKEIREDFMSHSTKNTESHRRLWEDQKRQDRTLNDHELRITLLQKHTNMEVENESK